MYRMAPSNQELQDMIIADVALSVAFSILLSAGNTAKISFCSLSSGIFGTFCSNPFLFYLPISFVAVSFSFILHEYMHKRVAQHYGAIAAFKRSDLGIVIALVTSFLGFLMALPGATMIYTDKFTKRQDGITSVAGPLTNFAVFVVFYTGMFVFRHGYLNLLMGTTAFIALWLAFVNMLPVPPLDGSKVLRWNKPTYFIIIITVFALLILLEGLAILPIIAIVFVLSLIMSLFSSRILFF